jgi:plastocyanin
MKYTLRFFLFMSVTSVAMQLAATTHVITQEGFTFAPTALTVEVGDIVQFQWTSGVHTTTSGIIPAGATAWDAPLTSAEPMFEYTVAVEGLYAYVCTPHALSGMVGAFTAVLPNNTRSQAPANLSIAAGTSANGQLFVHLDNAMSDMAMITLVDITGRQAAVLHQGAISDATFTVRQDVTTLPRGVYFVRFEEGARVVTRKVLIQ